MFGYHTLYHIIKYFLFQLGTEGSRLFFANRSILVAVESMQIIEEKFVFKYSNFSSLRYGFIENISEKMWPGFLEIASKKDISFKIRITTSPYILFHFDCILGC